MSNKDNGELNTAQLKELGVTDEQIKELTEQITTNLETEKTAEITKLDAIISRKADKVKVLNDALKEEPEEGTQKKTEKKPDGEPDDTTLMDERFERLELKTNGYPDEIVDEIMKVGGKKALENKVYLKVIDDMHEQYKAENSASIDESAKSEWEKKHTIKDLRGKSIEELEKILPASNEE